MIQTCFLGKNRVFFQGLCPQQARTGFSLLAGKLGLVHQRDSLCWTFGRAGRERIGPLLIDCSSSPSLQLPPHVPTAGMHGQALTSDSAFLHFHSPF